MIKAYCYKKIHKFQERVLSTIQVNNSPLEVLIWKDNRQEEALMDISFYARLVKMELFLRFFWQGHPLFANTLFRRFFLYL